jgi:hypothetical protein
MAKRQHNDPGTPAGGRRSEKPNQLAGGDATRERGSERDSGRSWVQDEPQLEQGDEPQRSGYSDRETPECKPGSRTGEPQRPKR